jgi:hypothetical protein
VTPDEVDTVLNAAEVQIEFGSVPDLRDTGYWHAVRAVKRDPKLAAQFADRIGDVDRFSFNAWGSTHGSWAGVGRNRVS